MESDSEEHFQIVLWPRGRILLNKFQMIKRDWIEISEKIAQNSDTAVDH